VYFVINISEGLHNNFVKLSKLWKMLKHNKQRCKKFWHSNNEFICIWLNIGNFLNALRHKHHCYGLFSGWAGAENT